MKLTFVSPRYGLDIVGGAEYAVRALAENCVKYGNVEAEVMTTTAADERTWTAGYPAGVETLNNIDVYRFPNEPIDRQRFDRWASRLLGRPEQVSVQQFDEWLTKQGPYSPELLEAIENSETDAVVFHPMLSSPTSHGIFRSQHPTVLHPALHDEPLARMPGYGEVLRSASMLAFSTRYEQELSMKLHDTCTSPQCVIGFGIDPIVVGQDYEKTVLDRYDLIAHEYVLVLGRVDPGKGSDLVRELWQYAQRYLNDSIKLVYVGPVSESSSLVDASDPCIIVTGSVDEQTRNVLLANACALISPSVTESFSLVVLEAMSSSVPVLVNQACGPTYEHVINSGSGAAFSNADTFVSALSLCCEDSPLRDRWIAKGKAYVHSRYSWENVIRRYLDAVSSVIPSS